MEFVSTDFADILKTFLLEIFYLFILIFVLLNFSIIVLFYTVQPLYSFVSEVAFLQQTTGIEKEQALEMVETNLTKNDLIVIAAKIIFFVIFAFLIFISVLSYFKSKIWSIIMKKRYSFMKFAAINSIFIFIYLLIVSLFYLIFEKSFLIPILALFSILFIYYLTMLRFFYNENIGIFENIANSLRLSKKAFSIKSKILMRLIIISVTSILLIIFSLSLAVFFLSNRIAFFAYFVFFAFVYSLIRYYYVNLLNNLFKKHFNGI